MFVMSSERFLCPEISQGLALFNSNDTLDIHVLKVNLCLAFVVRLQETEIRGLLTLLRLNIIKEAPLLSRCNSLVMI